MFRRDPTGRFEQEGFFWVGFRFHSGKSKAVQCLSEEEYRQVIKRQRDMPVSVMQTKAGGKRWWMFMHEFYWEDEGYSADQVKVLAMDRQLRNKVALERAETRVSCQEPAKYYASETIPEEVKYRVWRRENGRCVLCGSRENIQWRLIVPHWRSGDSSEGNVTILCGECARKQDCEMSAAAKLGVEGSPDFEPKPTRKPIPRDVKLYVWERDGGKCVQCGSRKNLEYDHIIPVSMGGGNTARNIQLLCEVCNRRKGGNLV